MFPWLDLEDTNLPLENKFDICRHILLSFVFMIAKTFCLVKLIFVFNVNPPPARNI